ncbi:hypothetical protein KR018_007540 [Drosophila ironensis]|nr:hypothetical protein KR018_007540 [Drosophila ironensis]
MRSLPLVIALVLLVILPRRALGQLPRNYCSRYFEYQGFNGQYIGLVRVSFNPIYNNHTLFLEFSQPGYHELNYVGPLDTVDDDNTIQENLRLGGTIKYRVDFPFPNIPPKITSIRLDDDPPLCRDSQYAPPSTAIALQHTLTMGGQFGVPIVRPQQGRNPSRNNPNRIPSGPSREVSAPPQQSNPPTSFSDFENEYLREPSWGNSSTNREPKTSAGFITDKPKTQSAVAEFNDVKPEPISRGPSLESNSIPCGRERTSTTTPLIFLGQSLERGQLPWLVGIFERRERNGPRFFCGGTLLSTLTVLSAAHCFRLRGQDLPASRAAVSLGRNSLDILSPGEFRGVVQVFIHENYRVEIQTEADLALVRMDAPVRFTDFIVPICLWDSSRRIQLPQGYRTYVAGWGPDESGTGNSDISKVTDLSIVSETNCTMVLPQVLVQPSSICARKVGAGPCASDGGGPLMLREDNVWVLRGVISAGAVNVKENTCDLTKPSVFTDVAKHIAWVRRNMWN